MQIFIPDTFRNGLVAILHGDNGAKAFDDQGQPPIAKTCSDYPPFLLMQAPAYRLHVLPLEYSE